MPHPAANINLAFALRPFVAAKYIRDTAFRAQKPGSIVSNSLNTANAPSFENEATCRSANRAFAP